MKKKTKSYRIKLKKNEKAFLIFPERKEKDFVHNFLKIFDKIIITKKK